MQASSPKTKEQLIHYLVNHISLGTYDKKFLTNVYKTNKPLTTNQNELLDKITLRYSKQLAKKELAVSELISLPWTRPLVISSPQYTAAHITTKDDTINIRTPYKKEYILKLKNFSYPIVWDKEERIWYTDYCAETLKYIVDQTESHFSAVNYSTDIEELIDQLCKYENCKYWNPTLVYTNGRYYLMASNQYLYDAVENMLESINLRSLTKLVGYGITIDDSVINSLPYVKESVNFAIEIQPTIESSNITLLVERLTLIGCDLVVLYNSTYFNRFLTVELKQFLEDTNIKLMIVEKYEYYDIDEIKKYNCTVFLTNNMKTNTVTNIFTDKIIHLVNSTAPKQIKSMYETV